MSGIPVTILPPARRLLALAAVIGSAAVFGMTYGLTAPLIAADLAARGYTEWQIGLNAAMHAAGVLIIGPLLPRLAVRFGERRMILSALGISAAVIAGMPWVPLIWLWYPLRIVLGVAAETLFVLSETWTNSLSSKKFRGRTMAIYTAAMSLGFACGPAILASVGTDGAAFTVGAIIAAVAMVPLLGPWGAVSGKLEATTSNPWQFVKLAPLAVGAEALNAAVETAGLSFISLYAQGRGWAETPSLHLVSTLMVGAILLQLPIGWLADKVDPRRLTLSLSILATLGAVIWPWTMETPWLAYTLIFVWGGIFVGIYTVMLMIVGSRFSGGDLVGIYAVMSIAWGGGALIGPFGAGFAMEAAPANGLPFAVASACALFTGFMLVTRSKA